MTIKQLGGVFGRNPTFNDVTIEGELTFDGDIDVNSDLKVDGDLEVTGTIAVGNSSAAAKVDVRTDPGEYAVRLENGSGSYFRVADGGLTEVGGNVKLTTAGSGIDFSATSGTGTSELFDDYEEGTWTPAYSTSGGGQSQTYSIQAGTYTKVGNLVTCHFRISISASSNIGSGNVRITGLPFAANGSNNLRAPFSTFNVDYDGSAGTKMHFYTSSAGVSFLQIIYTRDNTSWVIGSTTNFDIGTGQADIVCGSFSYYTDS